MCTLVQLYMYLYGRMSARVLRRLSSPHWSTAPHPPPSALEPYNITATCKQGHISLSLEDSNLMQHVLVFECIVETEKSKWTFCCIGFLHRVWLGSTIAADGDHKCFANYSPALGSLPSVNIFGPAATIVLGWVLESLSFGRDGRLLPATWVLR